MTAKNNQVKMATPNPLMRLLLYKAMIKANEEKMMERRTAIPKTIINVINSGTNKTPRISNGVPNPTIKLKLRDVAIPPKIPLKIDVLEIG